MPCDPSGPVSSWWAVPLHTIKGSIMNICENTWIRHKALYVIKWSIRKYPPHFPTLLIFIPRSALLKFLSPSGIFLSPLLFGFPACPPITLLEPHHTDGWPGCWQQRELVGNFSSADVISFFFSEKLSLADRGLSVWPGLFTITPDTSSSRGQLSILAPSALLLHCPPTSGEMAGSPVPEKGSHCPSPAQTFPYESSDRFEIDWPLKWYLFWKLPPELISNLRRPPDKNPKYQNASDKAKTRSAWSSGTSCVWASSSQKYLDGQNSNGGNKFNNKKARP